MFKNLLNKCISGGTLTENEAKNLMDLIMDGLATPSQISSLITILRFRGETVEELIGFARSMRDHMVNIDYEEEVIDTCGTGGDGSSTFNISTTSAIVVSSLGVKVAKHGNRAVSSKSGSADVLEHLGIQIQSNADDAKLALKEKGMSFLFAPLYHSAMKHAAGPRQEIGFRTIFNLLGPLANPARSKFQVIGVYDTIFAEKMAHALNALGSKHVLLVTGRDGLDECSITTETDVVELKDGNITRFTVSPEDFGLKRGTLENIQVSSIEESGKMLRNILHGTENETAKNIVLLNAGAALYVAKKAESISEGISMAISAIDKGLAKEQYEKLISKRELQNYA